ncbi:MAG: glucose 1-dehydrogenase [Dehalococcoidales bacterium]|nr:glucose 1-dehydrogenase [Dehalococcoidales bacterium]
MSRLFELSGKVAIVVGGSGGIGNVLAAGLADSGADIVVASRTLDKLEKVAAGIRAQGKNAMAISVDISQPNSVNNLVDQVLKNYKRIDILVNCAGLALRGAPETMPLDDWQKVMDFNVRGVFLTCQTVGKAMIDQGGGKIINMSSVRGRYPAEGIVGYGTSKGAVDAMTRMLAFEWARYKVLVNAIAPTVVATELTKPILEKPEKARSILSRIPLGRLEEPEDLIGTTIFLASRASDFITGQIIYVDGGASIS